MIQILITGGTIDKHYDKSGVLTFKDTKILNIIEQGRFTADYQHQIVMLKDSLEMTPEDRQNILDACVTAPSDKILITHGTDTMVETARYIAEQQPDLLEQKTIVFAGAMIPGIMSHSDATFNIGFALATVSIMQSGIYIAMSGQVFPWNQVHKNMEKMAFEKI